MHLQDLAVADGLVDVGAANDQAVTLRSLHGAHLLIVGAGGSGQPGAAMSRRSRVGRAASVTSTQPSRSQRKSSGRPPPSGPLASACSSGDRCCQGSTPSTSSPATYSTYAATASAAGTATASDRRPVAAPTARASSPNSVPSRTIARQPLKASPGP